LDVAGCGEEDAAGLVPDEALILVCLAAVPARALRRTVLVLEVSTLARSVWPFEPGESWSTFTNTGGVPMWRLIEMIDKNRREFRVVLRDNQGFTVEVDL
jgi:hypothetical protein